MGRPRPRREPSTERRERSLSPRVMRATHCNLQTIYRNLQFHVKHKIILVFNDLQALLGLLEIHSGLRRDCRSIPSCWHFLYRWLRSRPRARATFVMWKLFRLISPSNTSFSKASVRSASVPVEAVPGVEEPAEPVIEPSPGSTRRTSSAVMESSAERSTSRSTTLRNSRTFPGQA